MTKTGIVMELYKKTAVIMTTNGEFIEVKLTGSPKIGEIYTSQAAVKIPVRKYIAVAASIALIITTIYTSYIYNTVYAAVIININPSIKLSTNRWNRIIKTTPLNKDGESVLKAIKLKNKPLNDGLNTILEESKRQSFINDEYKKSGKKIHVYIQGNSEKINLSKFEKNMADNNLKYKINKDVKANPKDFNGKEHYNNFKSEKSKFTKPQNGFSKEMKNNSVNKGASTDLNGNKDKINNENKNNSKKLKNNKKEHQNKINENNKGIKNHFINHKGNENK